MSLIYVKQSLLWDSSSHTCLKSKVQARRGCYLQNPQNDVVVNGNKRTKKTFPDYGIAYTYATYMHILQYENNNHQSLFMKKSKQEQCHFFINIHLVLVNS